MANRSAAIPSVCTTVVGCVSAPAVGASHRNRDVATPAPARCAAPVASAFASSATATLPPARRSPMMPEPTTAASRMAVPTAFATTRRSRLGLTRTPSRRAHAERHRPLRQPRLDARLDLVTHPPKYRQPLLVAAPRSRRIVEAPVKARARAREHRTGLVGAVADGDHVVPPLAEKAIERLRGVPAQVDADLRHRARRERVDAARLGTGARHLEPITGQ